MPALRSATPSAASRGFRSDQVSDFFAKLRDITRAAPCAALTSDSALPFPGTMTNPQIPREVRSVLSGPQGDGENTM